MCNTNTNKTWIKTRPRIESGAKNIATSYVLRDEVLPHFLATVL